MKAQSCHKRNQVITRHKQSLTETNSHNDKIRSQHHKVNKTQPKRRRNDSNGVLRQRDKFPTTTDKNPTNKAKISSTNNNNENETTAKQNNHKDKTQRLVERTHKVNMNGPPTKMGDKERKRNKNNFF